jgi:hypothetical protein
MSNCLISGSHRIVSVLCWYMKWCWPPKGASKRSWWWFREVVSGNTHLCGQAAHTTAWHFCFPPVCALRDGTNTFVAVRWMHRERSPSNRQPRGSFYAQILNSSRRHIKSATFSHAIVTNFQGFKSSVWIGVINFLRTGTVFRSTHR